MFKHITKLIGLLALGTAVFMFASTSHAAPTAADIAKASKPADPVNCVKKDKNGKCPPPPKGVKPTPKKPVKK